MNDELSFWQRWRPYWIRIAIGCGIGIIGVVSSYVTHKWSIDNGFATAGMVLIALSAFSFLRGSPGGGRSMGGTSSANYARQSMERQSSWFWSLFLVALPLTVIAVVASRVIGR